MNIRGWEITDENVVFWYKLKNLVIKGFEALINAQQQAAFEGRYCVIAFGICGSSFAKIPFKIIPRKRWWQFWRWFK